jgi:PleD family two-component response regulator
MRIKILMMGDDPASLMTDGQLLRERGLLVFTAFNPQNMDDLIHEVRPDVIFFDPQTQGNTVTNTYNDLMKNKLMNLPAIYTLSDDNVYLVTGKKIEGKAARTGVADNIIDAIKMALANNRTYHKSTYKTNHKTISIAITHARA